MGDLDADELAAALTEFVEYSIIGELPFDVIIAGRRFVLAFEAGGALSLSF